MELIFQPKIVWHSQSLLELESASGPKRTIVCLENPQQTAPPTRHPTPQNGKADPVRIVEPIYEAVEPIWQTLTFGV